MLHWYQHSTDEASLEACRPAADLACDRYLADANAIASSFPGDEEKSHAITYGLALQFEHTREPRYLALISAVEDT